MSWKSVAAGVNTVKFLAAPASPAPSEEFDSPKVESLLLFVLFVVGTDFNVVELGV